jgi:CDP-diacylglycerol--glycerol-3-phosphate 3-phosphatidyltransferase
MFDLGENRMKLGLANWITITRMTLLVPFLYCMIRKVGGDPGGHLRHIAFGIFFIMCISDAVDGYVARVRHEVTNLGKLLDPIADKLLMLFSCILLSLGPTSVEGFRLPVIVAVVIIVKDFVLLGYLIKCYKMIKAVHIDTIMFGKITAVLQLTMIGFILIGPEMSSFFGWWLVLVKVLWWAAPVLAVTAAVINVRRGTMAARAYQREMGDVCDSVA